MRKTIITLKIKKKKKKNKKIKKIKQLKHSLIQKKLKS